MKLKTCPSICLSVVRLSICRTDNSPGTADIHISTAKLHKSIILQLQVCHCELMQRSACVPEWVEDKEVEKNLSNIPMKTAAQIAQWVKEVTSIQEAAGSNPAGEQIFFWNYTFCMHVFFEFSFDSTVAWYSS